MCMEDVSTCDIERVVAGSMAPLSLPFTSFPRAGQEKVNKHNVL